MHVLAFWFYIQFSKGQLGVKFKPFSKVTSTCPNVCLPWVSKFLITFLSMFMCLLFLTIYGCNLNLKAGWEWLMLLKVKMIHINCYVKYSEFWRSNLNGKIQFALDLNMPMALMLHYVKGLSWSNLYTVS